MTVTTVIQEVSPVVERVFLVPAANIKRNIRLRGSYPRKRQLSFFLCNDKTEKGLKPNNNCMKYMKITAEIDKKLAEL